LQSACVKWFRYQHSDIKDLLFSIPNGIPLANKNVRTKIYNKLKEEGLQPGVPDLLLAVGNSIYNGLFIEVKSKTDRLRKKQVDMIRALERQNYKCVVVRSVDEFIEVIKEYLSIR
jgi:anaerobic ribonucleoside-triphosphate reductase